MGTFKFDKEDVTRHIIYELDALNNLREPLDYIISTLESQGKVITINSLKKINLNKLKEKDGKNYSWSVINYQNVTLLVRRYRRHLTIFTKVAKRSDIKYKETTYEIGAFTFYSELKHLSDEEHDKMSELFYDKPFYDLNKHITSLLTMLSERSVHWVDNSAAWKIEKHIEVKKAFCGENISSIDWTIFCLEEIASIHNSLFSETTMLNKLEEVKSRIGEDFDSQYKIKEVKTKVENEYYHDAGILLEDEDGKTRFQDVYSLTCYYYDKVFKEEK